jgi:hypothetical protein
MDTDALSLIRSESIQNTVVEIDERAKELLRGIELDRKPALGEIDLYIVSAIVEAASNICFGFGNQIV